MTDVSAVSALTQRANPNEPVVVDEPTNGLTADFDTFLRLLTTQLQAQDPLQPTDSTEFVAQLAQFSTVEQQVRSNDVLDKILEALSAQSTGALADWLGREVRAPVQAPFDGAPITAYPPEAPSDTANATMIVRGEDGEAVAELPFAPGDDEVVWDGKVDGGGHADSGVYRFEARYANGSGATEVYDAEVYVPVVEARREEGATVLGLRGGASITAEEVGSVRAAPTG